VLSGISDEHTADLFPYRPTKVINSIADLVDHVLDPFKA
jgi:NagD protein